jgi:hypothetical protein
VGEQVEITPTDSAGGDGHADPSVIGQWGFRDVDQGGGKRRIGHIELDGAHPGSVRVVGVRRPEITRRMSAFVA